MSTYNLMEQCLSRKALPAENYAQVNKELLVKIKDGNEDAFTELVFVNARMIVNIMKKCASSRVYEEDADDLFQQGILGLHRAASRYDITANTAFSTYAYPWIKQSIFRYIASNHVIRMPFHITSESVAVNRFVEEYKSAHFGQRPCDAVICEATRLSPDALYDVQMASQEVLSLSTVICNSQDDDKELVLMDTIAAPDAEVDKDIIHDELHALLLSMILKETRGDRRNYEIFTKHYGLEGDESVSVRQLSQMYELTYERVRQIIAMIMLRLQKSYYITMLKDYRSR